MKISDLKRNFWNNPESHEQWCSFTESKLAATQRRHLTSTGSPRKASPRAQLTNRSTSASLAKTDLSNLSRYKQAGDYYLTQTTLLRAIQTK